MYAPTCTIGNIIYLAGASDFQGGLVVDTTNSFSFDPAANTIGAIAPIPRATGETRALNFCNLMYVMGGGELLPIRQTRWTSMIRVAIPGQRAFHSSTRGATSQPIRMAPTASGWLAATPLPRQPTRWRSSTVPPVLVGLLRLHLRRQRPPRLRPRQLPR
jgi:hypothetical protein